MDIATVITSNVRASGSTLPCLQLAIIIPLTDHDPSYQLYEGAKGDMRLMTFYVTP